MPLQSTRSEEFLVFLARDTIAGNQEFEFGSHKAAERVFRGADDRLASDMSLWRRLQKHDVQVSTIVCRVSDAGGDRSMNP